jgi:predicted nucleic acid-binding protein
VRPEDLEGDSILVDTNVFSRLGEGDESYAGFRPFLLGRFAYLSFVTVGEVLGGAQAAKFGARRLELIENAMRAYGVLPGNIAVARAYGDLWARLKDAGLPMQTNDLWIAATALAQDPPLPLLTNDGGFSNAASVSDLVLVAPDPATAAGHGA